MQILARGAIRKLEENSGLFRVMDSYDRRVWTCGDGWAARAQIAAAAAR